MTKLSKQSRKRTSQALRDILFNEIEELQGEDGNPTKAMAVANLAKQIINIAKVEIEFHQVLVTQAEAGHPIRLGAMELGTESVASAKKPVTGV